MVDQIYQKFFYHYLQYQLKNHKQHWTGVKIKKIIINLIKFFIKIYKYYYNSLYLLIILTLFILVIQSHFLKQLSFYLHLFLYHNHKLYKPFHHFLYQLQPFLTLDPVPLKGAAPILMTKNS